VQGADGNRVPLLRTGFRPAGAYTISFIFQHSGSPFAKKGDSELALPKMDIPISILEWEVFLPERYKVKEFGGDALAASLWGLPSNLYGVPQAGAIGDATGFAPGSGAGAGGVAVNGRNSPSLTALSPGLMSLGNGQFGGTVVDPSGAVVPNAYLEIQNVSTHATWTAATGSDGRWTVPGLPSGPYQITASTTGFPIQRISVTYDAANPIAYQIGLNIGSVTETVEVSSSAVRLDTESAQIGSRKEKRSHNGQAAPPPQASANVYNLQQRVAGVLPVAVNIPRDGASYRFLRPLVLNEETRLSFAYKSK